MLNPTVNEAYSRLGIDRALVETCPRVTPQINKIGRMVESFGLNLPRDPYYYLQASDSPDARAILAARSSIPKTFAKLLPIEAFCIAASVPTTRVPELIVVAAMRMGVQASSMIAAMAHPAVVKKTVEVALTDGGVEDRQVLHKATGFLPAPRGAQTQINISSNAQAHAAAASSAQSLSVEAPPVESAIKRLSERLNLRRAQSQPALPASTARTIEHDPDSRDAREAMLVLEDRDLEGEEADDLD